MEDIKTKNLADLDVLDSVGEEDYVLVESQGKFKKISSSAVGGNGGGGNITTPNWDDNDEESSSFIQNRTHYRTSLGNVLEINLDDYCELHTYDKNIPVINKTYAKWGTNCFWFKENDITIGINTISDDININTDTSTIKVNGVERVLTNYYNEEDNCYYSYDDNVCVKIYDDNGDISNQCIALYIGTNLDNITSLSYQLPVTSEVFEYHKLDDRYLNGSLIKKGSGYGSEMFNSDDEHWSVRIDISGDVGSTTYSYIYTGAYFPESLGLITDKISIIDHPEIKVVSMTVVNEIVGNPGYEYERCSGTIVFNQALNNEYTSINLTFDSKIASGVMSHSEGNCTHAIGDVSHAEGEATVALGNCSHTEGCNTHATGHHSHTEGYMTIASGQDSHAEGGFNFATGECSHAEGYRNKALNNYSHVEGDHCIASGGSSHAEGYYTEASGLSSHAEGNHTIASQSYSHAEGGSTTASGYCSHAEGYGTVAQSSYQHVFGTNNILDNTDGDNGKGSYIEIVGNGQDGSNRSNARTLDWSGNESLAGDITLGKGTVNEVTLTASYMKHLISGGGGESEEETSPFFIIGMTRSGDNNEILSLNQTWQDIRENIEDGKIGICKSINSTETISSVEMYLVHIVGTDSETYYVDAKDMFTTDTHHFTTSQPDENPQITSQP